LVPICDLNRLRSAFFSSCSIVFAAIAADMGDFGMLFHPSCCGFLLTVRQEIKDLMQLQIHQHRAKGSATAEREVVHTQMRHLVCLRGGKLDDSTQDARTLGSNTETRTQASAGGQANGFDFLTQSGGPACPGFQKSREPLAS